MRKIDQHIFQGMQRDLSISKQKAQFFWDANNIRLTAREGDTLMSVTNERGSKQITNITSTQGIKPIITGFYVGHCVIGNYLVVFTHKVIEGTDSANDYIFRIEKLSDDTYDFKCLTGVIKIGTNIGLDNIIPKPLNLNFSTDHPLQTLGIYENEKIQKVYWTDGINQPRLINITKDILLKADGRGDSPVYTEDSFDFVPKLELNDNIDVRKVADSSGSFKAGVMQYAISYYNKYGQESNISCTSKLIPTSYLTRAGSPEDKIGNAFIITINNPDLNYEFVRLYSIFRTSLNATPACKIVMDVDLRSMEGDKKITIVDNGTIGSDFDSKSLLYVGGESITAETIEQKDGTLFMGNIKVKRPNIDKGWKENMQLDAEASMECSTRKAMLPYTNTGAFYSWGNSLNAKEPVDDDLSYKENNPNTTTNGFKYGEHYRLGIQFQYKTGRWSEPVFLMDKVQENKPDLREGSTLFEDPHLVIPTFKEVLTSDYVTYLMEEGYVRARAMVVFPEASDRLVVAQGVVTPTVYCIGLRQNNTPYAQSSWFFRPWSTVDAPDYNNNVFATFGAVVQFKHNHLLFGGTNRGAEVQGVPLGWGDRDYDINTILPGSADIKISTGNHIGSNEVTVTKEQLVNVFAVDQQYVTMHSPEFEFDNSFSSLDTTNLKLREVGYSEISSNQGDIDIRTSTPVIGNLSTGFYHRSLFSVEHSNSGVRKLCAGLFYKDFLVDDSQEGFFASEGQKYDYSFMVYPWNRSTSLNNDVNRPQGKGTRTSELERKVISNLMFSKYSNYFEEDKIKQFDNFSLKYFNSEEVSLLQVKNNNYYGNIDMLLIPPTVYGVVFSTGGTDDFEATSQSKFTDTADKFFVGNRDSFSMIDGSNLPEYNDFHFSVNKPNPGDIDTNVRVTNDVIRMKYKSTPHAIIALNEELQPMTGNQLNYLYLTELYRDANPNADFGGKTEEALQANLWIPAGDPVRLEKNKDAIINYDFGDTYYQRYDCLKTYAFTEDDVNSVIEIGSFMVETRVNLDGRYDTHRGQSSNLYVSPKNFNLINDIYSQKNNFFNYRILDQDYYDLSEFPSMITWSTAKNNASDIDAWTNVTLASTMEVDGVNGMVTDIVNNRDTLYSFQEKGISQLLFNSRVAISTSDNVPIEISNNYKMSGNRYISTSTGCSNKFALTKSPMGVYFIDGISNTLYLLSGDQFANISSNNGFSYWFSQQQTIQNWKAGSYNNTDNGSWVNGEGIALYYDQNKKDLYISTPEKTLCYSELLGQFVSFYDYQGGILFNIGSSFNALTNSLNETKLDLWQMFKGDYNQFFYNYHPTDFTFISNAESVLDKTFTNLEMRADFYEGYKQETPYLINDKFFDTIQVTTEYQDTGIQPLVHKLYPDFSKSNTRKKFRIWRCDIPRAIKEGRVSLDRIRNTWCKVKISMNTDVLNPEDIRTNHFELHDLQVIYY